MLPLISIFRFLRIHKLAHTHSSRPWSETMHTAVICAVAGQHTTHLLFHITGRTALGTISHNPCTQCQLRSDTSSSRIQIPNSRSRARPSRSTSPHVGGAIIVSSTGKSSTESRYVGRGIRRAGAAVCQSRPFAVAGSVGFAMSLCAHRLLRGMLGTQPPTTLPDSCTLQA